MQCPATLCATLVMGTKLPMVLRVGSQDAWCTGQDILPELSTTCFPKTIAEVEQQFVACFERATVRGRSGLCGRVAVSPMADGGRVSIIGRPSVDMRTDGIRRLNEDTVYSAPPENDSFTARQKYINFKM